MAAIRHGEPLAPGLFKLMTYVTYVTESGTSQRHDTIRDDIDVPSNEAAVYIFLNLTADILDP